MSSENCTTKYMLSFVKKKKKRRKERKKKIYGMYKKAQMLHTKPNVLWRTGWGKEGQGDFSFSLYTILYGFIFLNFLGWEISV